MTAVLANDPLHLPWQADGDDARFRYALVTTVLALLLMGLVVPLLPVPDLRVLAPERPPLPLTQVVLAVPEPPVTPEPAPLPATPPPAPAVPAQVAAPVLVQPVAEPSPPEPVPTVAEPSAPVQTVQAARAKAELAGVLAFKDQLAQLRAATPLPRLSDTAALQRGSGEAARVERRLLTADSGRQLADVTVSDRPAEVGGVALAALEASTVAAPVAPAAVARTAGRAGAGAAGSAPGGRSIESIRRVFDAQKGAIHALYTRALRQQPGLAGDLLLQLEIAPDGRVTRVQVLATDLADATLVQRLARRVQMFSFGAGAYSATTITWPLHFLPQ